MPGKAKILTVGEEKYAILEVTRDQFRRHATESGWREKTIDLFLQPLAPVRKPIVVGGFALEVTDWPEPQQSRR